MEVIFMYTSSFGRTTLASTAVASSGTVMLVFGGSGGVVAVSLSLVVLSCFWLSVEFPVGSVMMYF